VTLAAIAGSFLLAWSAGAHAQTGDEESPFRAPRPEPKEGLLTPTEPTPPGGVPLLKRFVPGLADGLKAQTPFIRDTSLNLHLRSFYFNRLNSDESQNEAWAFGGWLAYKSGWLLDTARVGAVGYSIACVDCHEPTTMAVRVTRPGFIAGIKALKAKEGIADFDPNRDATRQEMRSFACGQCHVEYYFKGPGKVVTYPWANGLKVEEIEAYYEREGFTDFVHAETGNKVLKAQHPEFEVWSQGVHARAGVACADCHMPYERVGALKVSDHWVRSPLLNLNRACQTCHAVSEKELEARVLSIQDRHHALLQRAAKATTDMLDAIVAAKKEGASEPALQAAAAQHRKAQWRLDFVAAENSMGFHAPQELARILGEVIDHARQGQLEAERTLRKR